MLHGQRFSIELVLVLNSRQVQGHAPEHLIALPIGRRVAIGDVLPGLLEPHFLRHQPQQVIHVKALAQQQGKFILLEWRKQPLREFLAFYRNNTDGGVFRDAAAKYRHKHRSREPSQCRSSARAEAKIESGGNVRYTGEMDRLMEIARSRNLKIVEDAAHALPARYRNQLVGTVGDITCFSFYATKTITTGEGGAAVTENDDYADRMRIMSLHGISKDAWKRYAANGAWRYEILEAGYKYNLTDLQAALGLVQLSKCEMMWRRRASIAEKYIQALSSFDGFLIPPVADDIQHAWHLFVILVNPEAIRIHRDRVIEELKARGIGTSVHFIPLHTHPYYQKEWGYRMGQFPCAESHFDRCLSLPIYPRMTDEDVDRVIESLKDIAAKFQR